MQSKSLNKSTVEVKVEDKEPLVLKIKKKVNFTDDTVDNEKKETKSSKKCCIFHAKEEKDFDTECIQK